MIEIEIEVEVEIASWAEHDAVYALHDADDAAIATTGSLRSLVLDLFSGANARDLFNACARLGGLMAAAGASPSLVANTIDGAVRALSRAGVTLDPSRVPPARASLLEAYVASVRDSERAAGAALWEYPACAVPLADGTVAIACGYPPEDREALSGWASRVAGRLVKAKARRILLAGGEAAKAEVGAAATLVGVEIVTGPRPGKGKGTEAETATETRAGWPGWLRLPWRR